MKNHKISKSAAILLAVILCLILSIAAMASSLEESTSVFKASDIFTSRDRNQEADLIGAHKLTVADGENIDITKDGVYVISGSASEVTINVNAPEDAKVQLVLDGLTITNSKAPAIYALEADKVFVTTSSDSSLTVTGAFAYDADAKADAVIYSKTDLILNGKGTLTVNSTEDAVLTKDDLKVTGGTYNIEATGKGLRANDSVAIVGATINIASGDDGIHAENKDDDSKGYICIFGGEINIKSKDDNLHAVSVIQIDDGNVALSGPEGMEATYIQINGGTIVIDATDDGINADDDSLSYASAFELNGGSLTINAGNQYTDGIDSTGDILVNGGTLMINGSTTAFDYSGNGILNGGEVTLDGEQVDNIPNK